MRPTTQTRRRGTALIISVGLLAVLAVIGFGFAVLARLHHSISAAYKASAQNDLIAHAALQYAVTAIRYGWANCPTDDSGNPMPTNPGNFATFVAGAIAEPTESPASPWYVNHSVAPLGYISPESGNPRRYCNLKCNSYALVHDDMGARLGVSLVKVLDAAGKLNINDRDGLLPDGVGALTSPSTHPATKHLWAILKDLLVKLNYTPTQATDIANTILAKRNDLPNKRFSTLDDLKTKALDLVGTTGYYNPARTFELLKHHVTIYSWPHELPVTNNSFPYVIYPTGTTLKREDSDRSDPDPKNHKFFYRSPININTASKELLYALLVNVELPDGTKLTTEEADKVADWICRKRDPHSGDHWPGGVISGTDSGEWKNWILTSGNPRYNMVRERKVEGWRAYPIGPFDNWGETIDFFYSLAPRSSAFPPDGTNPPDPFPNTVLDDKKAEALVAALCPNVFAGTGTSTIPALTGYNAWHTGISRVSKDCDADGNNPKFREQIPRDRDMAGASATFFPQVTGKHQVCPDKDAYPLCFSSLGRHEVYTRTYTFLKADHGYATDYPPGANVDHELVDASKTWVVQPIQWRGYTVVIYEGKGKGQARGIAYIESRTVSGVTHYSLVTDRWSTPLDTTSDPNDPAKTRSRYYIVGPGAVLDRLTTNKVSVNAAAPYILTDTEATWEDGQWNGHRIIVYQATGPGVARPGHPCYIQERTIIDTIKDKAGTNHQLILSPELDPTLLASGGSYFGYIILGCDGLVEHSGAIKSYDVVRHTTQDDFEKHRPNAVSDPDKYTYAATGPNNYRRPTGTPPSTTWEPIPNIGASKIDGWLMARKKALIGYPANALRVEFNNSDLSPDEGGDASFLPSSMPLPAEFIKDALSTTTGRFTADGAYLTGGNTNYIEYRPASLFTNDRHEGGFVSFWFRPTEGFFTGTPTLIELSGEAGERIRLRVETSGADRVLKLSLTATARVYEGTLNDGNHKPIDPTAPDVTYKSGTREYFDTTWGKVTNWRPGEWHHIAFTWFEAANDDENHNAEPGYNDDGNIGTDWRDDDTSGAGGKPNYVLDDEVRCLLRTWVDGKSSNLSDADNGRPAFNFYPAPTGSAMVRLCGDACGTFDSLIVARHTDKALAFTVNPGPRYAGADDLNDVKYAEYQSPSITINNEGADTITLGTITWSGFLPWMKEADRWGGPGGRNKKFPIRAQAALGGTWSDILPANDGETVTAYNDLNTGAVFGGIALRNGNNRIESQNNPLSIQYRIYLLPGQGTDEGDDPGNAGSCEGLLKGRQTPVVEDVTVTYLGPVVFYFWK